MADLATLLTQLNRNAYIMDNIINATYIPEHITHARLAHCKEYLGKALDHMIKMGDAYHAISKQHPEDLHTPDVLAASARQDQLLARFNALMKTFNQLKNTLAINQVGDTNASPTSEESNPQPKQPTYLTTSAMVTGPMDVADNATSFSSPTNSQSNLLTTSPMQTTVETSTLNLTTDQMVATTYSTSQPGLAIDQMDTEIPSLASTPCTPQGEATSRMVTTISTSSQPGLLPDLRGTVTPITTLLTTSPVVVPTFSDPSVVVLPREAAIRPLPASLLWGLRGLTLGDAILDPPDELCGRDLATDGGHQH